MGRNKEQSARMLGHLVSNAPRLIRPYMEPILKVQSHPYVICMCFGVVVKCVVNFRNRKFICLFLESSLYNCDLRNVSVPTNVTHVCFRMRILMV